MKESRFIVSLALLVGAASLSCTSFSSGGSGTGTGGAGTTTGSGGSTGSGGTGTGGTDPTGTGGVGTTGTGGVGTTGMGGTQTTGTGGVGTTGTGGVGTTGTGGHGTAGSGGPGTGGAAGSNTTGTGGMAASETPCSILAAAGNACVAAHSTVRVVYPGYTGPLYQLCKGSFTAGPKGCTSGMTQDIGSVGGFADSTAHDTFCPTGSMCTISAIYDQSPMKNDLYVAPAGGAKRSADNPANANDLKIKLGGHNVYGVLIKPSASQGMGYRAGCAGCGVGTPKGTATGDQAETEYMVTSQKNLVDGCCFDYGNAETDSHDDGNGTMEAVYFGGGVSWGTGYPGGSGATRDTNGPWVMADLENGLFARVGERARPGHLDQYGAEVRLRHGGGRRRHQG